MPAKISAYVGLCKYRNSVDPGSECSHEQSELDLHCHRSFKNYSADEISRRLVVISTLKVNKCEFSV